MQLSYIESLGWDNFFQQSFQSFQDQGFSVGRIATQHKTHYNILTSEGELEGILSGKIQFMAESEAELPKVGDWVVINVLPSEKKGIIHEVLPRKTTFSRKVVGKKTDAQIIATNIDYIFIVMSLDQNYNLRRLERYLVLAHQSGAEPVIILSKVDLSQTVEQQIAEVRSVAKDPQIFALSSLTQQGIEAVEGILEPGKTIAFVGSSGVGKSTLINVLLNEHRQATSTVREGDNKGKHTTTRRELILLPSGGILIDTPGMRELQLWDAEEGLDSTFSDIEDLAAQCRFSDCTHIQEKGCAVLAALDEGSLDESRYASYLKLQRELDYLAGAKDEYAFRQKMKKLSRMVKDAQKRKGRK